MFKKAEGFDDKIKSFYEIGKDDVCIFDDSLSSLSDIFKAITIQQEASLLNCILKEINSLQVSKTIKVDRQRLARWVNLVRKFEALTPEDVLYIKSNTVILEQQNKIEQLENKLKDIGQFIQKYGNI